MANEWLRYANQGATRNQPLSADLVNALGRFAPQMGLTVEVFSGGQPGKGSGLARVGSVRHDHGGAADVFFHKDGRRLDWANAADLPIFQDIVRQGRSAGLTGFGAGPGYMQPGSMHVGFGNAGVWGAGGKGGSAPGWLQEAFNGAAAGGVQPTIANMQKGAFDPVGEVMAAATKPAAGTSLASFYGAPGATTSMANPDPLAAAGSQQPAFGSLALLFAQQQAAQQQRRADERAAEEARRAALFAPDSLANLFG